MIALGSTLIGNNHRLLTINMETFKVLFNDLGENIDGMLNSSQQEIDKIKCEYEQFKSELMNEVKLLRVELKELREIINSFKKKSLGTENISVVIEDVTASEDEEVDNADANTEVDNADADTEDDNVDANTEVDNADADSDVDANEGDNADANTEVDADTESGSDVDANEVDDADANTENDKENDKENDTESGSDVDANEGDDDEVDADSDVDANTEGDKDDDTESDKENDKDDDTESDEEEEIKLIKKILKSHEDKKKKRVYYVSDDSLGQIYECLADDEQGGKPIGKMKIHKGKGKPVPYYFK